MAIYKKKNGVWENVTIPYVKHNGFWKRPTSVWVNTVSDTVPLSAAWKQVWPTSGEATIFNFVLIDEASPYSRIGDDWNNDLNLYNYYLGIATNVYVNFIMQTKYETSDPHFDLEINIGRLYPSYEEYLNSSIKTYHFYNDPEDGNDQETANDIITAIETEISRIGLNYNDNCYINCLVDGSGSNPYKRSDVIYPMINNYLIPTLESTTGKNWTFSSISEISSERWLLALANAMNES